MNAEQIRVVHLDDDPELLALASEFLTREYDRFTVEQVTDPDEALSLVLGGGVDCVVTDYRMDEMDGLELLEQVRSAYPDLPVVFFTGQGGETVASEAIRAGVSDYVRKGSSETLTLLGSRIETLVARHRAEKRAAEADRRIRQVYERITVAFFALDEDYRFTYCNRHAMDLFGEPARELAGETVWDVLDVDEQFATCFRRAMDDQQSTHCEGEVGIYGADYHVELHAYPAEDGVSVFIDDRTDEMERREELEQVRAELELTEGQFRTLTQKLGRPESPFR